MKLKRTLPVRLDQRKAGNAEDSRIRLYALHKESI